MGVGETRLDLNSDVVNSIEGHEVKDKDYVEKNKDSYHSWTVA